MVTYVDLGLELLDGLDTTGSGDDLATTDLLTLDTTQQCTHVVASLALKNYQRQKTYCVSRATHPVELLVERLCVTTSMGLGD